MTAERPAGAPDAVPGRILLPERRTSTARLAAIGAFLAVVWSFSFVVGGAGGAGGVPAPLRVALGLAGGAVAPTFAVAAAVQLAAPRLRLTRDRGLLVLGTAAVAFCALTLVSLSFSTGMDGADASRLSGLIGTLTVVAVITSVLAFAATVALPLFSVLRSRGLGTRAAGWTAVGVGIGVAPAVVWVLLSPVPVAVFCVAVWIAALLPGGLPRVSRPEDGEGRAPADVPRLRERVTFFAAVSLAVTLVVWASGIAVSIAATGTPGAAAGLALAAAGGQIAVVPLLWAATLVVSSRAPRAAEASRTGFAGAALLVAAVVIAMTVATRLDGDLFVPLVGVLGIAVGLWCGSVAWPLAAGWPAWGRAGATAATVVGGTLLYTVLVAFSGGVTLALASGFVAFGGARYLVREARTVVVIPATPGAS